MAYLEPKLVAKLAQKQVLTPGLVQMVSLLTLNKLELTEMLQQELVQNPVLEEGTEIVANSEAAPEARQGAPGGVAAELDDTKYKEMSEPEVTVEEAVDTVPTESDVPDVPYGEFDFQSF